jgi:tRNA 5-methylaminomethyl-2-thiouridine biosynthesis bifunctional protein
VHDEVMSVPRFPVNGDGSFIPCVPTANGPAWMCGASFERGDTSLLPRAEDRQDNLDRFRRLLPTVSARIDATPYELRDWVGIRCASTDRRPLVGPVGDDADGLWISTAMGSRGLTFAALAGELIAARIHGEALPLARKLAQSLDPKRQRR